MLCRQHFHQIYHDFLNLRRSEKAFAKNIDSNFNFSNLTRFLSILTAEIVYLSTRQLKQIVVNRNFRQTDDIEMIDFNKQSFDIDRKYNANKKETEKRNDRQTIEDCNHHNQSYHRIVDHFVLNVVY